ncbi:CHAD domain-containing protein [Oryzifoliimicrobium ureilyticus]|uniref:CHAD domain-containing protein n=1 Tax=Oryzifoliimicrobium ureilyticus TaxID=3113724 RepID=UPI00307671B9
MSFRIRPDKDFTEEFKGVACEQLDAAIEQLQRKPDGLHAAVHNMRKRLKRVRSLIRLTEKVAPDAASNENARFRDLAKSLSLVRDATALIGTVEKLQEQAKMEDAQAALSRVKDQLIKRRDHLAQTVSDVDSLSRTITQLQQGRDTLACLNFPSSSRKNARMLAKSWRRTTKKAQKALLGCHQLSSDDDFHRLRKRTYDYRLFHLLLRDVWPSAMKAKYDVAKGLVERLGFVNDLAVLSTLLDEEPHLVSSNGDVSFLLDAIITARQENRQTALKDADRLFSDDADEEAERIELLWRLAAET